jgi:probable FeS assembly SUF system protein SufT
MSEQTFSKDPIFLKREVAAVEIPYGTKTTLPEKSEVVITQALGTSYTVMSEKGALYRIDEMNADALGLEVKKPKVTPESKMELPEGVTVEQLVWEALRTCFDPEIPVNIVDLGLIYDLRITDFGKNEIRVDIKMTLTAPGCGMGDVLKDEMTDKINKLPGVTYVAVELVFDPPWGRERMSEAARLELGI